MRAPRAWNFFGFSRKSLISLSSSTVSSKPATSFTPLDFPNDITFEPPHWTWFIRKIQNAIRITNGSIETRIPTHEKPPVPFESNFGWFGASFSADWIDGHAWSAG